MANQCKYYKVVRQVSYDSGVTWVNIGETQKGDLYEYDSAECGAVTQYRWVDVTGAYTCEGTTKYQKTKKQYSTDGTTWQDVSPAEYGKGNVIEYQSSYCGYVPPAPASGSYLTFVAIDDGRFKLSNNSVKYSLDEGSTWSTLASNTYSPTVYTGQKIMWKGELTSIVAGGVGQFSSTGKFNIEGNIMSLLFEDNYENQTDLTGYNYAFAYIFKETSVVSAGELYLPATTLEDSCYCGMFRSCTSLTTAPELPATTMVNQCYMGMFDGCSSLATAPELPATTLAYGCYSNMFKGCTSLTTAPSLPATTLAEWCYYVMFDGCSSLTTAPELPATTLVRMCYYNMFSNCTSLNYIKCLATSIPSGEGCTLAWTYNVASSGTFVKASSMNSWTRGEDGIPTNWTIQNA